MNIKINMLKMKVIKYFQSKIKVFPSLKEAMIQIQEDYL